MKLLMRKVKIGNPNSSGNKCLSKVNKTIKYDAMNVFKIITEVIGYIVFAILVSVFASLKGFLGKRMQKLVKIILRKDNKLDNYFNVIGVDKIKYLIYQLGLRPKIAIVDYLYIEYIKKLLMKNSVDVVLIFPSIDFSHPTQKKEDFDEFAKNVEKILKKYRERLKVINPFEESIAYEDILSTEFLETIKYVGSSKFIEFTREKLKLKIKTYSDYNKYHPRDTRLLSVYVHLVRSWIIWNYMKINYRIHKTKIDLGVIIWETEVDKLGIFQHVSEQSNMTILLSVILGKTIFISRNNPLPVFEPSRTVNIFDDIENIIGKLALKNKKETKEYIKILVTIIEENYKNPVNLREYLKSGKSLFKQYSFRGDEELEDVKKLGKKEYILLSLIHTVQKRFENHG